VQRELRHEERGTLGPLRLIRAGSHVAGPDRTSRAPSQLGSCAGFHQPLETWVGAIEVLLRRPGDLGLEQAHQAARSARDRRLDTGSAILGFELEVQRVGNGPEVLSTFIRLGGSCSVISQVY
jgi:hypothetical protein